MAVATAGYEAHVNTVLGTTQSIDACSTSTLRLLRALLGTEDSGSDDSQGKITTKAVKEKQKPVTAAFRCTRKGATRTNGVFTVLDCPEARVQCLPENRRSTLATKVFNKTLKSLTDAVKTRQVPDSKSLTVRRSPLKETQGRVAGDSKSTLKDAALRSHVQSSPQDLQRSRSQSMQCPINSTGLVATAECARACLRCLRQLKAENCTAVDSDQQLEQGALMLISKLQNLGLINAAIEETLNVRMSLEHIVRRQKQGLKEGTKSNTYSPYRSLVGCIGFTDCADNGRTLRLITAFQAQVLQLIAVDDKSLVDESLVRQLDPANPQGPCHMIIWGAEQGWTPADKAALQLYSLSQSVFSICSIPSNDTSDMHPMHVSPDARFQLQCLALQMRCHWWHFANHQPNIDKEIWAPFHRFMILLRRGDSHADMSQLLLVRKCLDRLLEVLSKVPEPTTSGSFKAHPSSTVINAIQDLAETTGSPEKALYLLRGLELSNGDLSGLQAANNRFRLAYASLMDSATPIQDLLPTMKTVLDDLEMPLKGTTTELKDLLLQASRLRKAAVIRLAAINEDLRSAKSCDDNHRSLSNICVRTIFGVLHFVVRYVTFKLPDQGDVNSNAKSAQWVRSSALVAQQSLKSALAAVQSNITHGYVGWELCIAALDDCLAVSKTLSEVRQDIPNMDSKTESMPTTSVKVSNMFWSWYLKQKDVSASASVLVSILNRSIQTLQGCTPAEKKNGFLDVKCEKAALVYMELRQFDNARQVLGVAINAHIEIGTVSVACQKALTLSPQQAWGEADCPEFMLGRILSAYARLFLKHQVDPPSTSLFDEAELKPDERALLLHKQFTALGETSVPESLRPHLREVARTVVSLYGEVANSLHNLRFISELLTLCSKSRFSPFDFLPDEALGICMNGSSEDTLWRMGRPSPSAATVHSSLSLQWAFLTATPSVNLLKAFVGSHTIVAESCDDWASVLPSFNNPTLVMVQVQSIIDFMGMQGFVQVKLDALLLMRRFLALQPEQDLSAMASCTTQIALEYTRMGMTSQAGRALATAESFLKQAKSKTITALQWHLAYAEYFTTLSSYEKAADELVSAQWRYEADFVSEAEAGFQNPRLAEHKYLAQAAYLTSKLAFENGDLAKAIFHAKKGVKIGIRHWTILEKLLTVKRPSTIGKKTDLGIDKVANDMSNMALSPDIRPQDQSVKAAGFWAYVQTHFDCLLHLSRLSDHCGSFQDAVYYAEQAKKIAEATGSDVLLCRAASLLAAHFAQADNLDGSQLMVDSCRSTYGAIDHPSVSFRVFTTLASAHLAKGEFSRGLEAVEQAQNAISRIPAADHSLFASKAYNEDQVTTLATKKASPTSARAAGKKRQPDIPRTKLVGREAHSDAENTHDSGIVSGTGFSNPVQRLQAEALILKSCICIRLGSCEDARNLLQAIKHLSQSSTSNAWYAVLQATLMLADAMRLLQTDAAHSVLAESPIAFPVGQLKSTAHHRHEKTARKAATNIASATSTHPAKKFAHKQASRHSQSLESKELIVKARELFLSFPSSLPRESPSAAVNKISCLATRMQLLSSVLLSVASPSPFGIACHLNAPKSLHWSRELASIGADIALGAKSTVFAWPETHGSGDATLGCSSSALDYTALQQQLSDTIPPSWNVLTVVLDNNESEILTSKIRRGKLPFSLRLPLDRTASEDLGEGPFNIHTAKRELRDIIASANLTAHDAKAGSDKIGRKHWWAARETLDSRMASLLHNIETVWLGGFRGIFSDRYHDEALLARFSESLSRTLDRHLPSRRKAGAIREPRFQLHPHVLELFVALGDPDEHDLDDAITDLLYFVTDILQFQGERNAYDEIDFDVIVMEVSDIIRSYHGAAKSIVSEDRGHTILILDKALTGFPWESLPCLEGQSVTRMPSLGCLQERLLRMREKEDNSSGLYIDPQRGAYILNPSSDLTSTQETFLDHFNRNLADYTSIVNRAPSETEFESCLRDKDLCLYFGHGSGAQYIRGRTIKRLKRCAVTFLMGCSSSKMAECGQFEPYGVPSNYLLAGSAAVVGTLWDVTDKDIDRFAMKAFVEWGLLGRDAVKEEVNDKARKMRGRGRVKKYERDPVEKVGEEKTTKGVVALDDAVAKARDACLLRYLNGAAPVIYGIPVYLASH